MGAFNLNYDHLRGFYDAMVRSLKACVSLVGGHLGIKLFAPATLWLSLGTTF